MSKDPTSLAGAPQLPVIQQADGTWAIELKAAPDTDDAPLVTYERLGGIVRVQGIAVVRQHGREVEHPVQLVLRVEDAKDIAASIMGTVGRVM
jgi:hypothetical protein